MNQESQAEQARSLKIRIRKIVGQLNAIEKMIDADRDCTEILTQLVSARSAIKSLSEKVIDHHLQECVEGANYRDRKKRVSDLLLVLKRYVG